MEPITLSNPEMDRLSETGHTIYNEKLKPFLEPAFNGQEVAIHLESGDYEVGRRSARPAVVLRQRHPDGGVIMSMLIGPPRSDDVLAYRMLLSQANPGRTK